MTSKLTTLSGAVRGAGLRRPDDRHPSRARHRAVAPRHPVNVVIQVEHGLLWIHLHVRDNRPRG